MLAALRRRYSSGDGSNGVSWAFVPHVRDAASWDGRRTCDAIAMALWKSKRLLVHGFEVKISRADWLREMRQPEKAEGWLEIVDRWWLVVSDETIVQPGELPEAWGLLAWRRGRLECVTNAPALRDVTSADAAGEPLPPGLGRSFLAVLLRAAVAAGEQPARDARVAGIAEGREQAARELEAAVRRADELEADEAELADAFGMPRATYGYQELRYRAAEVAGAVRVVLAGGAVVGRLEERLRSIAAQADDVADAARKIIEKEGSVAVSD